MAVSVNSTIDIKSHLGIEPNGRIQKAFTNSCYKHMDKYVPMDLGDLRTVVNKKEDSITYESPYAHAQYVGYTTGPVVNYTTSGTGPYWDKRMVSAEIDDIVNEMQKLIGGK